MTSPIPDAAIEAGARFLCAEMSDDFREGAAYWKNVATGFVAALAAEGLVVVPREATPKQIDAIEQSLSNDVLLGHDYILPTNGAETLYRAMIEAAREGKS